MNVNETNRICGCSKSCLQHCVAAAGRRNRHRRPGLICLFVPPAQRLVAVILLVTLFSISTVSIVRAAELEKENDSASDASDWQLTFAPGGYLYPLYIADPRRPTMGIARAWFSESDIPAAGNDRYIIRLGANVGFLRFSPADKPDSGLQLDVGAGFLGVFDLDNRQDNIGWDGIYSVLLSWSNGRGAAIQAGLKHVSSHVGDEYAEETGRRRINYTRGEYVLGLSLSGLKYWRIYGEGGYAYDQRNEQLQKHWRLQSGLEFVDPKRFWKKRFGWYAAADLNWYEESDWSTDVTAQAGLIVTREKLFRSFRLGVEYRNGRSILGEFFFRDESYVSLGLWCDI